MDEASDATEAFALLGNEHRMAIMRELLAADRDDETPVGYADLRRRVGIADGGQFSYHLRKLDGRFVAGDDGGYEFTDAGWKVARAVLAAVHAEGPTVDPFDLGDPCAECGGGLQAESDGTWFVVTCPDCDARPVRYTFPTGGFEARDREQLADAVDAHLRADFRRARGGVCPECAGPMTVSPGSTVDVDCERCGNDVHLDASTAVLLSPVGVAFARERGRDPGGVRFWSVGAGFSTDADDDGVVTVTDGDATLRARVRADGRVVEPE